MWHPRYSRVSQVGGEDVYKLRWWLARNTPASTPGHIRPEAWWRAMWGPRGTALAQGQLSSWARTQLRGRHGWVCYITVCKGREDKKRGWVGSPDVAGSPPNRTQVGCESHCFCQGYFL